MVATLAVLAASLLIGCASQTSRTQALRAPAALSALCVEQVAPPLDMEHQITAQAAAVTDNHRAAARASAQDILGVFKERMPDAVVESLNRSGVVAQTCNAATAPDGARLRVQIISIWTHLDGAMQTTKAKVTVQVTLLLGATHDAAWRGEFKAGHEPFKGHRTGPEHVDELASNVASELQRAGWIAAR